MLQIFVLALVALMSHAKPGFHTSPYYVRPTPIRYVAPIEIKEAKPYSFGYSAPAIGGGSSRQETSDGNGRVSGSYTVSDVDGRLRVVDYYADETGFHANVKTNEPGTANQDSADVTVQSYAAPVVAPVVATPKVYVAPTTYLAPSKILSPAPVYTLREPFRRIVAPQPISYSVLPVHNPVRYSPAHYASYTPYYRPFIPRINYLK